MALILIVDDDSEYAGSLSKRLRRQGFDTNLVGSGMAALDYCRTRCPDLILLDWVLAGGLSGRVTLEFLRKARRTRDIPVIVISGQRLEPDDEREALRFGARNFLAKAEFGETPASMTSLERHVRALLPQSAVVEPDRQAPVATLERPAPPSSAKEIASDVGPRDAAEKDLASPVAPTLLVIDDQEEMAELLRHLFKAAGYQVEWASTGRQGLSRVMTEFPDLVVLDLHMPEADGREICRALREKNAASSLYLPILILTGDRRESQQVRCLDVGADDFLVKPPSNDVLCARVNALLRRARFHVDVRDRIAIGRTALDCRTHEFSMAGEGDRVALTKTEAGIMFLLMSARGRAVDHRLLHRKVCRACALPNPKSSTIKSHISHIRAKLGRCAGLIAPVNGEAAYRFDVGLSHEAGLHQ
jgi:DNA-binding response OmpR family regulator